MPTAVLHDGSTIDVEVHGDGPAVLLPVNPRPAEGEQAESMRAWGADPALGRSLIDGLRDTFRVVAFGYEDHVLAVPKPATLTPDNIAADFLSIADAAGVGRFAYYGYSWLAVCGLQLALRTDRLTALAMGGYPPLDGPYAAMLAVTAATADLAAAGHRDSGDERAAPPASPEEIDWSTVEVTLTEAQTQQFLTLYRALDGFDDSAAQARLRCARMCFAGSADQITYDERWGGVHIDMAAPLLRRRHDLEALGWEVHVLDGLDHTQAMQAAAVLPILRPWLRRTSAAGAHEVTAW